MKISAEINHDIIAGMRVAYYGYLSEILRPRLEREIKKSLEGLIPMNLVDEIYEHLSEDIWHALIRKIIPFLAPYRDDGDAFRKIDLKDKIEKHLSYCLKKYDMKLPEKD